MFRIGSPVFATDGKVGVLQYVVLEPHSQEVSDLVVKCDLFTGSRVISARHIDHVDEDGAIHLSVDKAFVRRTRKFDREEFTEPGDVVTAAHSDGRLYWQDIYGVMATELPKPATHVHIVTGIDDGDVLVGKGSRVFTALGEHVGTVDHVVIDPDARKLLYLVVRLPGIRRRRVVVAASQVKEWQSDAVVLDMDKDALYALPPYIPAKQDETLAQLVRQAIAALGVEVEHLSVFWTRAMCYYAGTASRWMIVVAWRPRPALSRACSASPTRSPRTNISMCWCSSGCWMTPSPADIQWTSSSKTASPPLSARFPARRCRM